MATCVSGDGCKKTAVESKTFPGKFRFCSDHQARLDALREHLDDVKWTNQKSYVEKFCTTSGCDNRPIYGSDYCAECSGGDD